MTRENIIRMAREAGIKNDCDGIWCDADQLSAFAALVRSDELEACAKVCDELAARDKLSNYYAVAAKAIRARGQE